MAVDGANADAGACGGGGGGGALGRGDAGVRRGGDGARGRGGGGGSEGGGARLDPGAGIGKDHGGQALEKRSLAGAVWADRAEELARADAQVDAVEGDHGAGCPSALAALPSAPPRRSQPGAPPLRATDPDAVLLRGGDGEGVLVTTSNAPIEAEEVRGHVDLSTSNGTVTLALAAAGGASEVHAATSNGGNGCSASRMQVRSWLPGNGEAGHSRRRGSQGPTTTRALRRKHGGESVGRVGPEGLSMRKARDDRGTTIMTIDDIEQIGIEKVAEMALEVAWSGAKAVYFSFDIDSVDAGSVPGTGWPEPSGFLPREALKLLRLTAKQGLAAMEVVEVCPPYDQSDQTALLACRARARGLERHRRRRRPISASRRDACHRRGARSAPRIACPPDRLATAPASRGASRLIPVSQA